MYIKHYITGNILFSSETILIKDCLETAVKQGVDLQDADLRGANLRGADLQGADLQGANLRGADLQGANLQGANLQGANLQVAYLQGADLQGAYLQGADLRSTDLKGANLQSTDLRGADLRSTDLQGALLAIDKRLLRNRKIGLLQLSDWNACDIGVRWVVEVLGDSVSCMDLFDYGKDDYLLWLEGRVLMLMISEGKYE